MMDVAIGTAIRIINTCATRIDMKQARNFLLRAFVLCAGFLYLQSPLNAKHKEDSELVDYQAVEITYAKADKLAVALFESEGKEGVIVGFPESHYKMALMFKEDPLVKSGFFNSKIILPKQSIHRAVVFDMDSDRKFDFSDDGIIYKNKNYSNYIINSDEAQIVLYTDKKGCITSACFVREKKPGGMKIYKKFIYENTTNK